MLTQDQIDEIKAREAAATPAPWRWSGNTDHDDPRLIGGPRRHSVMVVMRRERKPDDPETKNFESYLREQEISYVDAGGKERWRAMTDEEIAEKVKTEWLEDPWEGPNYDDRMAFRGPDNLMRYARDLAVYEVCPNATSRADDRVYRADIIGVRHPDAEFMAKAREDVPALLAELGRVKAELKIEQQRHALVLREIGSESDDWSPDAKNIARAVRDSLLMGGCDDCPPDCRFCAVDPECGCDVHPDVAESPVSSSVASNPTD